MLDTNNTNLIRFLHSPDLLYIHKFGKKIVVYMDQNGKHTYRISFKNLNKIKPAHIIQVHQSYIININKIEDIIPKEHYPYEIMLVGEVKIPLSRRFDNEIR